MDFKDKNFQDALRLAEEAKKDQLCEINDDEKVFDFKNSPKLLIERMEITAKLSFLVSWFFYQKAVESGEMTEEEVFKACKPLCENCIQRICENGKLLCEKDCMHSKNFLRIRDESNSLYCRVSRIDKMIRSKKAVTV